MYFFAIVNDSLPIQGLEFNFMPSWWYRNYGIEYGERMIRDPDYRVATHQTMRRLMAERFGALRLGETDPKPLPIAPDWGNASTSALVGCEVEYPLDNYPVGHHLPEDRIDQLSVPDDLWSTYPFNELARQIGSMNGRLGTEVKPTLPTRGVLNDAVILHGDAFFTDMYVEPERAKTLLDFSVQLLERQVELNGGEGKIFNCTVPLIGPRSYEERIFDYDRRIASLCQRQHGKFFLHHCGRFDEYAPVYRRLTSAMAGMDIGYESDTRKVMDLFPEAGRITQVIEPRLVISGTTAQVGEKIDQLMESTRGDWHRLWLSVGDIEYGAPDENLLTVYEHVKHHKTA